MCKIESTRSTPTLVKDLAKEDEWLNTFDLPSFTADIHALGQTLNAAQGTADVAHLDKLINWSNAFGLMGLVCMGFRINFFAVVGLSTWTFSRWTMIAHHTCHGGYDKIHPVKSRWNRFKFAIGSLPTRILDWFDWMLPEAWNVEHNNRHHYCLSEVDDPDLVENNTQTIRDADWPIWKKYALVAANMVTWKWMYYAPNTYKEFKLSKLRNSGQPIPTGANPKDAVTLKTMFEPGGETFFTLAEFFYVVAGPYLLLHFFVMPLPLIAVAKFLSLPLFSLYKNALVNLFLADLLTNFHSFLTIVTNHAGEDLYRFDQPCKPYSGSFYLRQVLASVDFAYGSDSVDFFHGFLSYQIEHHLWPSLSMLSYQKAAPLVKALCLKHNVPYVQMSVWIRLKMTVDIMVGKKSMRVFPKEFEERFIEIDEAVERLKNEQQKTGKELAQ